MKSSNIYQDIATRTNGDIYIGVVGPVRVGKSTFITKFMEEFVLPNISNLNAKACTIDELPQSADGVNIMTTQPKFVPAESVRISVADNIQLNVKLIDCVGYFVKGAQGHEQDNKPRMVKTPWQKELMPLEKSAEMGTHKVVSEHSTIAILMTTDGTFGEIPRDNFIPVENRLVQELREYNKPFVMVVNSQNPKSEETQKLVKSLKEKHNVGVIALKADELNEDDVSEIFEKVLDEFPLVGAELNMPLWMTALDFDNPLILEIASELKRATGNAEKVGDFDKANVLFAESVKFEPLVISSVEMGEGKVIYDLIPKPNLFFEVLSSQCGMSIKDDFELVSHMKELAKAKSNYDKIKGALGQVESNGYGVVLPTIDDLKLEEPELVKQGGSKFGIKLRASAPSLHIMRVDIETEINPMVGTEEQGRDLIQYLSSQSEGDPEGIWNANMF